MFAEFKEDEAVLIQRLRQGERPAFDELVGLYRNRGLAVAYNLAGNLEDAKDILQEAFIKVYLNIKSFKEESRFSTWFYRILVNCSLDFLRKRKRAQKVFAEPFISDEEDKIKEIPDEHYAPDRVILNKELAQNLDNCIASLPQKQMACFQLKHQNGLSTLEIAQILGCNVSTVKVHLFRSTRTLQDKLSAYLCK